ncbi:MAG: VCBS repeat-containing protein [Planctomycetes bacterium]|nr:VCBS repeat-containing protein [Planctomycetota bacterium]
MRQSSRSVRLALAVLGLVVTAPAQRLIAPLEPAHVPATYNDFVRSAADFDGDGRRDLVGGDGLATKLWFAAGPARWRDPVTVPVPPGTWGVPDVIADLDGDGDLDLAWLADARLMLNDGHGAFALAGALPALGNANVLIAVAGDVDADGDADLLLATFTDLRVWVQTAPLVFEDRSTALLPTPRPSAWNLAIADLDRDGDAELLALRGAAPAIYVRGSSGVFADESSSRLPPLARTAHAMAVADFDGDTAPDLVLVVADGQDELLLNDGQGRFAQAPPSAWPRESSDGRTVAVADLEGDGDLDLLFFDLDAARLWVNRGAANFVDESVRLPSSIRSSGVSVFADLDGDGDADILGDTPAPIPVFLQDARGDFVEVTVPRLPRFFAETGGIASGDFDADGDTDLALTAGAQGVRVWRNDGSGRFEDVAAAAIPPNTPGGASLLAFDADGDGVLDLYAASWPREVLLIGNGDGSFRAGPPSTLTESATPRLALDADRDGDIDVLAGDSRGLRLLANDGTGGFTDLTEFRLPAITGFVGDVARLDVNRDRRPDLIVCASSVVVLVARHDGSFTDESATRWPVGLTAYRVAVADFDGDGDLDVAASTPLGTLLLRNDGRGRFAAGDVLATSAVALAAADFDDDGDVDLYLVHRIRPDVLLENDGQGSFRDVTAERVEEPSPIAAQHDVSIVDVDGDQDPDLVFAVGDVRHEQNTLFLCNHRGLHAPYAAQAGAPFELRVSARPGYATRDAFAFGFLALDRARIEVPPLGTWQLDPRSIVPCFLLRLDAPDGHATARLPIPALPALAGRAFFVQAAILESPLRLRFTGVVAARVL